MNDKQTNMMLIGVGGGGCRLASAAVHAYGATLPAIGFDTDALATRGISNMRCMLIGAQRYDGHGTGGDSVKGRTAVQDDLEGITAALSGVQLAVVVTALGGGVGNGATPLILSALRNVGAHTLCFATLPFALEGKARRTVAERALPMIEENSDALVVLPMDQLFDAAGSNAALADAIPCAESIFSEGLTLFWRLILTPGFISLDSETLLAALAQSTGRCRFAVAAATGDARSSEAVAQLCRSPLLGKAPGLQEAQAVTLGVLAGGDLKLTELAEVTKRLQAALAPECEMRMGTVLDERYAGEIHLVALFFDVLREKGAHLASPGEGEGGTVDTLGPIPGDVRPAARRARAKAGTKMTGRGRFKDVEATWFNGEDLDRPTYLRQGITLDR